jgi:hypothetical protein
MQQKTTEHLNSSANTMLITFLLLSMNFNGNIYTQTTPSHPSASFALEPSSTTSLASSQQKPHVADVEVASVNGFTLQLMLLSVLICIIGLLLLSIQAFVAYDKFQQLYGDELNFALVIKNIFKSLLVRFMVYRQIKVFFNQGIFCFSAPTAAIKLTA